MHLRHILKNRRLESAKNDNLCPYKANQTLPNKDSQTHKVLVVWDGRMQLQFTQWQCFPGDENISFQLLFYVLLLLILLPTGGFAKIQAYTPFVSILILCFISMRLLYLVLPSYQISIDKSSTPIPNLNLVFYSGRFVHQPTSWTPHCSADWIHIWAWQIWIHQLCL